MSTTFYGAPVGPIADPTNDLYEELTPLAYADAGEGYPLLTYCQAITGMLQPINNLARDTPAGPGWSQLLDITRCPTSALPWLGQFVGVQVNPALTDGQQRAQIQNEAGMQRGTVAAIQAAAANLLTGGQNVIVIERVPDPYSFTVITYTSETPNPAAVLAALEAAKPAGLILTYLTVSGQTWAELVASYATWATLVSDFPNWQDVINNTP